VPEKEMARVEAIINSMTKKERLNPKILNVGRKQRIAKGSGVTVAQVNQVVKQFDTMRSMMQKLTGGGGKMPKGMPGLGGRMPRIPSGNMLADPTGLGAMPGMGMPGMGGMGGPGGGTSMLSDEEQKKLRQKRKDERKRKKKNRK
jgi:signal recognition particle subunit SRP54